MAIEKIFFAILIIICAVFYILYIGDFSLILLIIISVIPIWMLVSLLIMKKKTSAKLYIQNKSVPKNEPFNVKLVIKNDSIFSCAKAEAVVRYTNLFNGETNEITIHFPIHSRNTENIIFQLKSKFCGVVDVKTGYIRIYDPLKIFNFRIAKNIGERIVVMPVSHEISGYITYGENENDEGNIYSQYKSGDDPSEVFDLREYVGGDKINRIHWKLSCKKNEFIVKELSLPIDVSSVLFLDLHFSEKSEYTLPFFDTMLESLLSISEFLLTNEKPHTLIVYNSMINDFEHVTITSFDELVAVLNKIIVGYLPENEKKASLASYVKTSDRLEFTSFTYISSEINKDIINILNEDIVSDVINAVIVTKALSEKTEDTNKFINIIEVPVGKISSAINSIEL
ncbi:MAG: DUF58 domain-containing protein [Ruminococcus sp.]|nr:DUF58 domain-containing protein [Ruminococcus sp.]